MGSESIIREPLRPDFRKILQQFKQQYGNWQGTNWFWQWINKLGLNPDKPYGWSESFKWLEPSDFQLVRQDKEAKCYEAEAAFPLTSMNNNIYTRQQLADATARLVGRPVNLNHDKRKRIPHVDIRKSKFPEDASQLLLRTERKQTLPSIR